MAMISKMKVGDIVRFTVNDKIGKCLGPIYHCGVWWMQVEWSTDNVSLVHKDYLEVVDV
jgi:hypothetical protein